MAQSTNKYNDEIMSSDVLILYEFDQLIGRNARMKGLYKPLTIAIPDGRVK
jgi:hypothetical protein